MFFHSVRHSIVDRSGRRMVLLIAALAMVVAMATSAAADHGTLLSSVEGAYGDARLDYFMYEWNDSNGDGIGDVGAADANLDGIDDSYAVDADFDGYAETLAVDSTGDGVVDTYTIDTDNDGALDSAGWDTDQDGAADYIQGPGTGGQVVSMTTSANVAIVGGSPQYTGLPDLLNQLADATGNPTYGTPDSDYDGTFDSHDAYPTDPYRY